MNAPLSPLPRMDRRTAIKWMMTAAATTALGDATLGAASAARPKAQGYGTDPDLTKSYQPGDVWPLTFTDAQRATAAALCDVIIPADEKGPAASQVHVPDFIDEWISAPYGAPHDTDRRLIVEGLSWLDAEAQRRFRREFARLDAAQHAAICDEICHLPRAKPEHRQAAQFFKRFRDLAAGGYYTTPEGMRDIGFIGNFAMEKFEIPAEVLRKLGLA